MSLPEELAPLFEGVEPLAQDEGPEPVVRIAYANDFVVVMGYFRRMLVDGEFSARSLKLSAAVIEHNAANYTAWQYRRQCLARMHADSTADARASAWREELAYCTDVTLGNMKNYQVWFHRRACVEALGDATGELEFVRHVLDEDAKNYHAWGHRQWVIRAFSLWKGELEYIETLLSQDPRNNSAWNQRYFVLHNSADLTDPQLVANEVAYALRYIELTPSNSSPWAYLKGVVERGGGEGYAAHPSIVAACEGQGECVQALAMLVEVRQASGRVDDAKGLCARLAGLDPIRARYWQWRGARAGSCAPQAPEAAQQAA